MNSPSVIWLVALALVLAALAVGAVLVARRSRPPEGELRRHGSALLDDDRSALARRERHEEAHAAKVRARTDLAEAEAARERDEAERLIRLAQERLSGTGRPHGLRVESAGDLDRPDPDVPTAIRGGRYDARVRALRAEAAPAQDDEARDTRRGPGPGS